MHPRSLAVFLASVNYMPVAILSSLAVTIKNVCKHWQLSPEVEEAKLALTENHCFRGGIPLPPSPS